MISDHEIAAALESVLPQEVLKLSALLKKHGHRSWIVGGCVRDVLAALQAGRSPKVIGDWDLATSAHPEEVTKIFRRVIPTGIDHGTVTVVLSGQHFELTTLRGERGHSDGRRPDEVYYVDDLREDLARRDFTVNAMAFDVEKASFHDPFNGREDLEQGLLRAVGDPSRRFFEDGLRVLRCARFCSTLEIGIETKTLTAIRPSLSTFKKVAQERVRDEWFKALSSKSPSRFLGVIRKEGLLEITAPKLWKESGLVSFDEALIRLDDAPRDPIFRLALFIVLSCPLEESPSRGEKNSDARARGQDIGARFRLSKVEKSRLVLLCSYSHLTRSLEYSPSAVDARQWLSQVGRESAEEIIRFQTFTQSPSAQALSSAHEILKAELDSGSPLSLKELPITGGDLIKEGIVARGPDIGRVLSELLRAALKDPSICERSQLMKLAEALSQQTN